MHEVLDFTTSWQGFTILAVFVLAYVFVIAEEFTHLRKSKPVLLAAGIIWILAAVAAHGSGHPLAAGEAVRHNILEVSEILLFLLVAMSYINALEEREVFNALRSWLIRRGFGYRSLFWLTGLLAFFISPIADNMTTALLMGSVVVAVGGNNKTFISLACVNIVVAANAGGAFSPFGDITTLMVWQSGLVSFWTFFNLFLPALVNWIVPAACMHFGITTTTMPQASGELVLMRRGAKQIMALFLATIATSVVLHQYLHLPSVLGMLTGLAYLKIFGYHLRITGTKSNGSAIEDAFPFDVFEQIRRAEWDTLLFFVGILLCVGGVGFMGYLEVLSHTAYVGWGATEANIAVGVLSAIIDNIPIMFAVLSMEPDMSLGNWLLVTLTAGVGGSMLSVGSAAGVALMGTARGTYTFVSHLKWSWAVALGYAASIATHYYVNHDLFAVAIKAAH